MNTNIHKLENNWVMWIHNIYDSDWSINSYKQIYSFDTLEELIKLNNFLNNNILSKLMIFFMKDNIKPIWEDINNKDGGSFSYKISNHLLQHVWKNLVYALLGNTLIDDENILKNINGISISPKKNYCIIKLWLANIENFKNTSLHEFINNSINSSANDNKSNFLNYDPLNIHNICNIEEQLCIFKKHNILY
jgi:translation initiation factor 4E